MNALTESTQIVHVHCAFLYSSETTRKSDRDETGSDLDLFLLSQDIDSAIDRFLPSSSPNSTHSNVRNDARIPREEFLPVKINDWDLTTCHDTTESECMLVPRLW